MALVAGQQASKTENIRCEACRDSVRVEKGDFIQTCVTCGNNTFESRKSGSKSGGKSGNSKSSRKGKNRGNSGMTPALA